MEPNNKKAKMVNNKFKQNKKKYYQKAKKHVLQVGQRGFLVTCNMNEKACVRECYNLLNVYADQLYGTVAEEISKEGDFDSDSDDLDAAVAKCKEEFSERRVRFQNVDTGTTNCLFIKTRLADPVGLGKHIVEDITKTGKAMSRFIMRLVPIEAVCRANMPDIINAAGLLFDKHFLKEPTTYGIIFNHRYNQQIKRDHIIKELADLVNSKNVGNKVDLHHAKKSIIVEVLRGWCLLSVIENYLDRKKYNLAELTCPTQPKTNGNGDGKAAEAVGEKSKEAAAEESTQVADETIDQKSPKEAATTEAVEEAAEADIQNNSVDDTTNDVSADNE
ncbi:THUMP domain-containing protein 1 homolog [Drosophila nasuta]|uniref:THUMP domain-containing protein 1 homolog n=1 Tax=Drosophila nasuta TaxID=42062 RepID=UPI00295F330B|nr:THUMP domain-containing protein 1 homolog [Drosophila nasuta]